MIKLGKESHIVLLAVLTVSLIANVAACFTISQYTTLPEPIIKTVLVHDTVTVTKTVYSVEFDTVRVDQKSGKPFITIDEYLDHKSQLPAEYQNDYIYFGFMRKSPHQFWGRKFGSSIKDFSLGCHGKLKRDIPTHPGWVWCTGDWVATFKEPIPMWNATNKH